MKITAGVVQKRLEDLLFAENPTYLTQIERTKISGGSGGNYGVNIQNTSANNIYVETINVNAVIGESRAIATGTDFNFVCARLRDISIISDIAGSVCVVTIV